MELSTTLTKTASVWDEPLWPFSNYIDPETAAQDAIGMLHGLLESGGDLSSILADAYQSRPTSATAAARSAMVAELMRLASFAIHHSLASPLQ